MPAYDKMHAAVLRIQKLLFSRDRLTKAQDLLNHRLAGNERHTADGSVNITVRSMTGNSPNLEHEDLAGVDIHTISEWDKLLLGQIEKRLAEIEAEILEIERTT